MDMRGQRTGSVDFTFDSEKLIWWEVPVMMALATPDSLGVLHNHFNQYGVRQDEAWGRPRDTGRFPGAPGFAQYTTGLYYRYLNLGFKLPPSAGSATGVLPNPAGYNRMYVRLTAPFNVENWYTALRDGASFVTNGPMLFFDAKPDGNKTAVHVKAQAREPLQRIEIVANGEVIRSVTPEVGAKQWESRFTLDTGKHSWLAARCFRATEGNVRRAHTSPVYLPGKGDASADAQYFVDWIDALIAESAAPKRFAGEADRDAVLKLYREARAFYAARSARH